MSCFYVVQYSVDPKKYAQGSPFVVLCFDLVTVIFTHILQGYSTGTGANHMIAPVPLE